MSRFLDGELVSHRFRRGQLVFVEGTPAHSVFVLRSGCVKVYRTSRAGGELVLRLLGPGELVGYRPVLADEPYAATAEVLEESELCVIPAERVRAAVRELPELAAHLLDKLAKELRLSEELMMDLLHLPVRQRAARLLLNLLSDGRESIQPIRIESRFLRRQDMARMIGVTPETFSRVMRGFAQKGLIALTRDSLEVRDEARLRRLAGHAGRVPGREST